jgi:hypothetical protein
LGHLAEFPGVLRVNPPPPARGPCATRSPRRSRRQFCAGSPLATIRFPGFARIATQQSNPVAGLTKALNERSS